jgi:hypothetical protein
MSLQIEIIPNQPLGWIESDTILPADCREGEYCSPMFISDNNAWEVFVARAIADGATPVSDFALECAREIAQPFIQAFDTDVFSFQARYIGEVESVCDVKEFITENEITAEFAGNDGRYKPDTNLFTVEFNWSEAEKEPGTATWNDTLAIGCVYTASLSITPLEDVANGIVTIGGTEIPVPNSNPFSTEVTFTADSVDLILGVDAAFEGTIFLAAIAATCVLEPVGLVDSEGNEVGVISLLQNDFSIVGDYTYQSVRAFVTINVNERNGDCFRIKFAGSCCCDNLIFSRCVQLIESEENTIYFNYSQQFNGFGFVYTDLWVQSIRLIATWRNPFWNDEAYQSYIDSAGRKNVIYSEPRKAMVLSFQAPDYVHNAMALAVRHDGFRRINEIGSPEFLALVEGESYNPNWNRDRIIAPVVIELEEQTQNYQSRRC